MTRKKAATVTAPATLEELQQVEQRAMQEVAEARAAARGLHEQREARRTEAEAEHDRRTLADWTHDRPALEAAVGEAREALRQAVLRDPTWQAYGALVAASTRLVLRSSEASAGCARALPGGTGCPSTRPDPRTSPGSPPTWRRRPPTEPEPSSRNASRAAPTPATPQPTRWADDRQAD